MTDGQIFKGRSTGKDFYFNKYLPREMDFYFNKSILSLKVPLKRMAFLQEISIQNASLLTRKKD